MDLKRLLTTAMVLAIIHTSTSAADPSAGQWAQTEKANLAKINRSSLFTIIKGAPGSYAKLFTEVKTEYKSNPLEITRIAALTQLIASSGNVAGRSKYADELIKAAKGATAGDVICFFIDQLRWCATPNQTIAIKSFESSKQPGVAAIAAIAAFASERNFDSQQKDIQKTVYAEYGKQIAKLSGSRKAKALISGFDNADLRIAGIALREASQIDVQGRIEGMGRRKAADINKRRLTAGKSETQVWALKLEATSDPIKKVMLLDMLGVRGNPAAAEAIAEYISDADLKIAAAAQNALTKISPQACANAMPDMLKNLPASHASTTLKTIMRLQSKLIEEALLKDYESYSLAGKQITLTALQTRKLNSGITLAVTAINGGATENAVNGYRLLRDCATVKEADLLISKLSKERGKRLQEAQSAVAAAAKRDTSGSYISKLESACKKTDGETKEAIIGTFGRIGSKELLKLTESSLKDADTIVSTAAIRALASWNNNDSIKALMTVALKSTDNKQRILAKRGIEKKLGVKGVNKAPYKKMWSGISKSTQGNAEIKKQLDDFFSK